MAEWLRNIILCLLGWGKISTNGTLKPPLPTLPNPGCLLLNESLPHTKWEELSKSLLKQQKASHLWELSCSLPTGDHHGEVQEGCEYLLGLLPPGQ